MLDSSAPRRAQRHSSPSAATSSSRPPKSRSSKCSRRWGSTAAALESCWSKANPREMKTLWPTARNLTSILSSAVDEQSGDPPLTGKVPFFGKLAFVDLTRETVVLRDIPGDHFRTYLGGPGLVLGELLRLIPAGADPLG